MYPTNFHRTTQVYIDYIDVFDGRYQSDNSALFVYKRPLRWGMIFISSEVWAKHTKTEKLNSKMAWE